MVCILQENENNYASLSRSLNKCKKCTVFVELNVSSINMYITCNYLKT